MKNLTYTLLLSLIAPQLVAQSDLTFFTEEGEKFTLYVYGNKANDEPVSRVTAADGSSDFAQIKVEFEVTGAPELKQNMLIDANMHMTTIIKKNKKGRYVFRGVSSVPKENDTQTVRVVEVRENTSPSVETNTSRTQTTTSTANNTNSSGIGVNISANTTGINLNVNVTDNFTEASTQTPNNQPIDNTHAEPVRPAEPDCTKLSSEGFNRASSSIKNKSFADEKLTVFKQISRAHCMSVSQIKRFMDLFAFEEGKLEVAKLSYANCTNRENYYELNDALTYSESVDELNRFLENQ